MNIQLIKIEPLSPSLAKGTPRPPATPENCYWALAIEDGGKFYFWGRGISLPISEEDYVMVKANPKLFVGSTSYYLNLRISFLIQNHRELETNEHTDK
jgi:hypothetical protein